MNLSMAGPALVLTAAVSAMAQSPINQPTNISPSHFTAWQENCGWTNWHDAGDPAGDQGAVIHATFLSGMVWIENAGWLCLGDGAPGSGRTQDRYANVAGDDAGVNIRPDDDLDGFAWGENIGWVCFNTRDALGQARARLDRSSWRLRGYAWGENIGWVNLDHVQHYVGQFCYADCDDNGLLGVNDFMCFLNRFAAEEPSANCDQSTTPPILNVNDFMCYMNKFAAGCP